MYVCAFKHVCNQVPYQIRIRATSQLTHFRGKRQLDESVSPALGAFRTYISRELSLHFTLESPTLELEETEL